MSKSKKIKIEKAMNKRVNNVLTEHGDTFRVEVEIKGAYLLHAPDGWSGWINDKEAKFTDA